MEARLDRTQLRMHPLSERHNKLDFHAIGVYPDAPPPDLSDRLADQIEQTADRIVAARRADRPVMLTYGAHLIKNGLAPVVIRLLQDGWVTHVATNGAGSIHDWEFAYQGRSSEDVRENTAQGRFGTWEETGRYINLAVAAGGIEGLGYGGAMGKMIARDGIDLPAVESLRARLTGVASAERVDESAGAIGDMLHLMSCHKMPSGKLEVCHRCKEASVQYAAYTLGIPFTVHPGIGYDIIYTHPLNCGGAIGRGAVRDFLSFADSVRKLSGGVHVSVGSAVMAPMIFEKALSMANNLALQQGGRALSDYHLAVVDIQDGGDWDWRKGEPPMGNPAYYLRFCKTFYRMGGTLEYFCVDNQAFMLGLYGALGRRGAAP
ncbi:MAG: hypothetical protein WCI17_02815 [bacterium]